MPEAILDDISHRRYNPLRGSWLLVSPHRTKRPWQGAQETPSKITLPEYDPACYLCPGNKRAQGDSNPKYVEPFVFVNDYSAVKESQAEYTPPEQNAQETDSWDGKIDLSSLLLRATPVTGRCYVLTFSPHHNLTLADLTPQQILPVVQMWTQIYSLHLSPSNPLSKIPIPTPLSLPITPPKEQLRWMQIFENKGAAMGCSNPHPHGQIWTTTGLPEEPAEELIQLQKYRKENNGRSLLADYVKVEMQKEERIVFQNNAFLVVCPWWATWPFEVMIISKEHRRALVDFTEQEQLDFAEAVAEVTRRYDNLFETSFPYSSGIHQAPLEGTEEEIESSHFHMHFYPPLLRSATVRKFLVGYELMAEPQRDITPEQAAKRLREDCGGVLYRKNL
ncbi:probable galactose-1-phosphate uridylyltransferase [Phialocephala subalpina]|uniref:Galactose-1-phosphate uridylyltransferase n=1 Tax=Phialocephala subalpina TaxID=576137 RepID=A0A1L7XCN7_9HELO|nr:probable galactose-1-phosphate uridylyltransferase [Phialocephala subalpina]